MKNVLKAIACYILLVIPFHSYPQKVKSFRVISFYTAKNDAAHISFVREANHWFTKMAGQYGFDYHATNNWKSLNDDTLSHYQVVIFLDSRPEEPEMRNAFKRWMENGGSWMGFHFAAFALNNSDFPQNWDWYHSEFIGAGSYLSNTWRPTSAILRVENKTHPVMKYLPEKFLSAPNEWYR